MPNSRGPEPEELPSERARQLALGPAVLAGLATAALLGALALFPGERWLAIRIYLLAIAALALIALVRIAGAAYPAAGDAAFDLALRARPGNADRLEDLDRLTRLVTFASWSAVDWRYRLGPILREIAAHRLATRRGIDLDTQPEAARTVLGPEAWELVRPVQLDPSHRHGPGVELRRLAALIATLEEI